MLCWDQEIGRLGKTVGDMSPNVRSTMAQEALQLSFSCLKEHFHASLRRRDFRLMSEVFEQLHLSQGKPESPLSARIDSLEGLIEDADVTGLWEIVAGISTLRKLLSRQASVSDVMAVLSFSYQAVLQVRITSKLLTETTEDEVAVVEKNDEVCAEVRMRQLGLIRERIKVVSPKRRPSNR